MDSSQNCERMKLPLEKKVMYDDGYINYYLMSLKLNAALLPGGNALLPRAEQTIRLRNYQQLHNIPAHCPYVPSIMTECCGL